LAPAERSLAAKMEGRPFRFVGVNADPTQQTARRSAAVHFGAATRHLWCGPEGPEGPLPSMLRLRSWPFLLLVDADGRIRWRSHRIDGIEPVVERAVREAEQARSAASRRGAGASGPLR
jgi:hypothetical protein